MFSNNTIEGMLILGTPFLIMGVAAHLITQALIRHRERMAKIRQGIDPDAPPKPR